MSDYTKATNFTTKDTLPTGNANKIVKGAEIDAEFTAIASAVASKADSYSPVLTGVPVAPTAATGTATTQIATTAFVANSAPAPSVPSGSVMLFYQTSAPTGWTQVTTLNDYDLRLVSGAGGTTGGTTAYSTVFTNQTPSISGGSIGATTLSTAQMPSHSHQLTAYAGGGGCGILTQMAGGTATSLVDNYTANAGGGGSHTHSISSITSSAITLNVRYANIIICSKN